MNNRSKSKTKLLQFVKVGVAALIGITLLSYAGVIAGIIILGIALALSVQGVIDRIVGRTVKRSMPTFEFSFEKSS